MSEAPTLNPDALARVAEQLESGESEDLILLSLLGEEDRALLKLLAAVRSFDTELAEFLGSGVTPDVAASLDRLELLGYTERVPGTDVLWRLREEVRAEHFARWFADRGGSAAAPVDLVELSEKLVAYYDDGPHLNPLEALYHELVANPAAAAIRFEALYAQADERFELPRCHDLVDVLTARVDLTPSVVTLREEYRRYLDSRGAWIDDFYGTSRFVQPGETKAAIDALLGGRSGRAVQIWATGGIGKTTLIRWLIARRCVPKPTRIACARVDFDTTAKDVVLREPWLLLLEIAWQLNRQLRDTPFQGLLNSFGSYRELLYLQPRDGATRVGAVPAGTDADVIEQFEAAIRDLEQSEPVLVVLDTLEVIRTGDDDPTHEPAQPLFDLLGKVHATAPALRLVLSGRYDVADWIPRFPTLFTGSRSLRLTGFTEDEAQRYLVKRRHISRPEFVDAAIRFASRADAGNGPPAYAPIDLALLADLIEAAPELEVETLSEDIARDVRRTYLIQRIVKRMPEEDVRWALRYGVVPRVLDLPFVQDVLAPWIVWATSAASLDKPADDRLPGHSGDLPLWNKDLSAPDADDLWDALKRYASPSSWVRLAREPFEMLRFQPEVVEPMRQILWEDRSDLHERLQRDACAYFERKAERDTGLWARWTCEAVFHRFQLEGPAAAAYWRTRIALAQELGRADFREEIAADLFHSDYLEDARPKPWRRGRLMRRALLVEARYQQALGMAQLGHFDRAASHLEEVERSQRSHARPVVSAARIAAVEAAVRLARGDLEGGRGAFRSALRARLPTGDRLWLLVRYARAIAPREPDDAVRRYRAALKLAGGAPIDAGWRETRLIELAAGADAADDVGLALSALAAARDDALPAEAQPELVLLQGTLRLRLGDARGAVEAAALVREPRAELLAARAHLAALRPIEALGACDRIVTPFRSTASAPEIELAAEAFELRAAAHSLLLEADRALEDFVHAADLWGESFEGVARTSLAKAAFQLRELGDVNEASVSWEHAERTAASVGGVLLNECLCLEAEIALKAGDPIRARRAIDTAMSRLERDGGGPREHVRAALAGLALGDTESLGGFAAMLCAHLVRVRPATARLPLLTPLKQCGSLESIDSTLAARLRRLAPSPMSPSGPYSSFAERDLACLAFVDVELDRVLGRTRRAVRTLESIQESFLEPDDGVAWREWLGCAQRLGVEIDARATRIGAASEILGAATVVLGALVTTPAATSALVGIARPLLERAGGAANVWRARLSEALAREARERGDDDEARMHLELAAQTYDRLGNRAAFERVGGAGATEAPAGTAELDTPSAIVIIEKTPDGVTTEAGLPDGTRHSYRATRTKLIRALTDPKDRFAGVVPPSVARLLVSSPEKFARDLGSLLAPKDLQATAAGDLKLQFSGVHPLPWELARLTDRAGELVALDRLFRWIYRTTPRSDPDREDMRAFQIALRSWAGSDLAVDGLMGPRTEAALAAFQRDAGLTPTGYPDPVTEQKLCALLCPTPSVTIVRSSLAFEDRYSRGLRTGAVPLERIYASRGFAVEIAEEPSLELLREFFASRPTTIVHVVAGLVEAAGSAALDYAAYTGEWYKESPSELGRITSSAFDLMLRGPVPKPILVLDVPVPRGPLDIVQQLFLRNVFASELLAVGSARAIIATGLARGEDALPLYESLVDGLASGESFGQVVRDIRAPARDGPVPHVDGPGFDLATTALFTRSAHARSVVAGG